MPPTMHQILAVQERKRERERESQHWKNFWTHLGVWLDLECTWARVFVHNTFQHFLFKMMANVAARDWKWFIVCKKMCWCLFDTHTRVDNVCMHFLLFCIRFLQRAINFRQQTFVPLKQIKYKFRNCFHGRDFDFQPNELVPKMCSDKFGCFGDKICTEACEAGRIRGKESRVAWRIIMWQGEDEEENVSKKYERLVDKPHWRQARISMHRLLRPFCCWTTVVHFYERIRRAGEQGGGERGGRRKALI